MATKKKTQINKIRGYCDKKSKTEKKSEFYLVEQKYYFLVYGDPSEFSFEKDLDPDMSIGYNRAGYRVPTNSTKINSLEQLNKLANELDFDENQEVCFTRSAWQKNSDVIERDHDGETTVSAVVNIDKIS